MRDPEAYVREGRNNPTDDQQREEHPYDFVSLPAHLATRRAPKHGSYPEDGLSGSVIFTYETLTPMHVGSGIFETAADCDLGVARTPVRGMQRCQGRPVLPGAGWKGAVRSRYETITRSRLALCDLSRKEKRFRIPEALEGREQGGKMKIVIADTRVHNQCKLPPQELDLERLSPADALFGCLGYRGRVHPGDGKVSGPDATEPLQVAPLDSPAMHRLAKPGKAIVNRGAIEIQEVEGRKAYYDGPIVKRRQMGSKKTHEMIDHVPAGCRIEIEVHLFAVAKDEVGALLIAAGWGNEAGIIRFGGYKPVGLGKVDLLDAALKLHRGAPATRHWRAKACEPIGPEQVVQAACEGLIDPKAMEELNTITRTCRPERVSP